jgi:Na+/proline symporter
MAFPMLLTHQVPSIIGAWCMVGIVAASLSTASGAVLAMGTVFSHNIVRQLSHWYPELVTADTLLLMARLMTFPFALTSAFFAVYSGETGYLLIVAFDIVLASVVCPLVAAFYVNNPSPRAALCSTVAGIATRIILEFSLPKDGFLILPFNNDAYYDYGSAASADLPTFVDPGDGAIPQWDPAAQVCEQEQFRDYTGVDSLGAFFLSILVFATVQTLENYSGKPLFTLPGLNGYDKEGQGEKKLDPPVDETEKVSDRKEGEGGDEEEE